MPTQYKRSYELQILPTEGNSRTITELRINFNVTHSVIGLPNAAKIEIFNANNDTLAALQRKFTRVILNVGYGDNLKLLFRGEVRNVFQSRKGVDSIVTIYSGDNQKDWVNSKVNKTFAPNATVKTVINDIVASFKNITGSTLEGIPDKIDKLRGQVLSGQSAALMDRYADEYGFDWTLQNGEIITTPKELPLSGKESIVISSQTGMIGSPTITERGVDVTTLLNTELMPNRAFSITSSNSDIAIANLFLRNVKRTNPQGTYKIQESIFKGDSRDGSWLSSIKGIKINA